MFCFGRRTRVYCWFFFFSRRRRHTRCYRDWSSDVCSSDLLAASHMQWLIEETGKTMSSVGAVTLRMSVGIYSGPCAFFLVEGTHRELLVTGPGATATIGFEDDSKEDSPTALDPDR